MMLCRHRRPIAGPRRGGAAVELAILLPLLAFLFVITVDFARVFHHYLIATNCARSGALYGSMDATHAADKAGIRAAALADATNLDPGTDVATATGTDAAGDPYLRVTVTSPFQTFAHFPGVPSSVTVTRTVQMRIAPTVPKNS